MTSEESVDTVCRESRKEKFAGNLNSFEFSKNTISWQSIDVASVSFVVSVMLRCTVSYTGNQSSEGKQGITTSFNILSVQRIKNKYYPPDGGISGWAVPGKTVRTCQHSPV